MSPRSRRVVLCACKLLLLLLLPVVITLLIRCQSMILWQGVTNAHCATIKSLYSLGQSINTHQYDREILVERKWTCNITVYRYGLGSNKQYKGNLLALAPVWGIEGSVYRPRPQQPHRLGKICISIYVVTLIDLYTWAVEFFAVEGYERVHGLGLWVERWAGPLEKRM